MVTHRKTWTLGLLLLTGLMLPAEPEVGGESLALRRQAAELEAVRARAARVEQRHLECVAERATLDDAIASRIASCDAQVQSFQECRAERHDLEGAELWGCGLGLAMGVASRLAAQPWKLTECGLADAPESLVSCPVPACTLDPVEVEREVLAEHGRTSMPYCDEPSA